MNPGQKQFYDFFMGRAREDKREEARALLEEGFAKQEAGTFDRAYLERVMPQYFEVVRPEAAEELKVAMGHFAARL